MSEFGLCRAAIRDLRRNVARAGCVKPTEEAVRVLEADLAATLDDFREAEGSPEARLTLAHALLNRAHTLALLCHQLMPLFLCLFLSERLGITNLVPWF